MTDFFDFLGHLGESGRQYSALDVNRMNWRYEHIIAPIKDELHGARVLDLGAHDGRWSYACAAEGATVTGIEGRAHLIAQHDRFPNTEWKQRITLTQGDFMVEMDRLLAEETRFDVVMCLGVFYHTIQHYRMLLQMTAFQPKLIVIDGTFDLARRAIIAINNEATDVDRFTIASRSGQTVSPIGRPSRKAVEVMAESLGYTVDWRAWVVPESQRGHVQDYFDRPGEAIQRMTCFLRPS